MCCLEQASDGIGLHVNAKKSEYVCFNQKGDIPTLNGSSLILMDRFTYPESSVSSSENGINMQLSMAWTAIDRLSIIWNSDLFDKIQRNFFQAAVMSILLYGCTTRTLTKLIEKKLDENYTMNKSWQQHPTEQQLYGHFLPISKTTQIRRARHARHYWGSKDELIGDVLPWTRSHGRTSVGRLTRNYLQQLCTKTGCSFKDLPETMEDRGEWRERKSGKSMLAVWHDDICIYGGGTRVRVCVQLGFFV